MRAPTVLILVSSMIVAGLAVFPAPTAAAASGDRFWAIYLDDPAITSVPPTADEGKTGTLTSCPVVNAFITTVTNPECKRRDFGAMPDHGFGDAGVAMTSPVLVQVWLSATTDLPLLDLDIALIFDGPGTDNIRYDDGSEFFPMRNSTEEFPVLTVEPQLVSVAYPPSNNFIPKETPVSLSVTIDIPGAVNLTAGGNCVGTTCAPKVPEVPEAETDVFIHYASKEHPSGVFFIPDEPVAADRSIGKGMFQMYLANDGFEGRRPDAPEVQKREIAAGTPDAPATTEWGSAKASGTYTFVSDAALYVPVAYEVVAAGSARAKTAAFLDFSATLKVNDQNFTGYAHIAPASDCRSTVTVCEEVLNIAVSLPTNNLTIAQGDTFSLSLSLSAVAPPGASYKVWYGGSQGGKNYHAGLFAALGEAVELPAPPTTPTPPPTTPSSSGTTPTTRPSTSTSVPTTSDDTNESAGSAKEKDIGYPAQVLPNLTVAFVLAAAAIGLAVVRRRRA